VAGDAIRNNAGVIGSLPFYGHDGSSNIFYSKVLTVGGYTMGNSGITLELFYDFARQLPTANENRVRTLSGRFWRRVA
jgi:hypothetical protein